MVTEAITSLWAVAGEQAGLHRVLHKQGANDKWTLGESETHFLLEMTVESESVLSPTGVE